MGQRKFGERVTLSAKGKASSVTEGGFGADKDVFVEQSQSNPALRVMTCKSQALQQTACGLINELLPRRTVVHICYACFCHDIIEHADKFLFAYF